MYAAVLTVVCGGLLAFAAEGLKDKQQANIDLEQKKNILSTVITLKEGDNILDLYKKRVKEFVVDYEGNVKEGLKPSDVIVATEYKKPAEKRLLPVYEFRSESDPNVVENVVLPVYGYGLWNNIWGFVALKSDYNTVQGVTFSHASETPGLGARIETPEVQERFRDKKVFEGDQIASIVIMKGEGNDWSKDPHKVDGMSGATLTGKGVNNMLKDYFGAYQNYIKKNKKNI